MNRHTSEALSWLNSLSLVKKTSVLSSLYKSKDFLTFSDKFRNVDGSKLPLDYYKYMARIRYATNTVNGQRQALQKYKQDRLKPEMVWMPNGKFGYSRLGSLIPLGVNVQCTPVMMPFIDKKHKAILVASWDMIKNTVMSSPVGDDDNWISPWLDYDPVLKDEQDVYFILDSDSMIVKIGISKDIPNRLKSIREQYSTGKLRLVSVIAGGGCCIEQAIHKKFKKFKVDKKGKGKEWFEFKGELADFIFELGDYAYKSDYLKIKKLL